MIRVRCPGCQKKLVVKEATAAAVSICPACKQRFRVPAPRPQVQPRLDADTPSHATATGNPAKQGTAKSKPKPALPTGESGEQEDLEPVPVARRRQPTPVDDEEPVPAARRRKRAPVEDEVEEVLPADEEGPVARPRKRALVSDEVRDKPPGPGARPLRRPQKRRPKKRRHPDDISTGKLLAVIGGVMFFVWIGVAALVLFVPKSYFPILWLTLIVCALCRFFVRYVAREEGTIMERLMLIFVPFYDIYFAIRYPQAAGAVVMQYFCWLILITNAVIHFTHDLGQVGARGP